MILKRYIIALLISLCGSFSLMAQTTYSDFSNGTNGSSSQNGFPKAGTQQTQQKKNGKAVLDDSTKVIYGPKTSRYFYEEDVFNNRTKLYLIDTSLANGFHNYNFVNRHKNLYQDLGNLGTAIRPIFYQAPEQIGTMLGYDAYAMYAIKPSEVKYYNTKSPFSKVYYANGGSGQDILSFDFNRNIDSLWNIGLSLQRITATKQLVGSTTTSNDNAIGHWDFMLHTNFQTKNKKYLLLAHANLTDHNSNDEGGVLTQGISYDSLLRYSTNSALLKSASTRDKWINLHAYHEYVGYKAFQVFQVLDYQSRKSQYVDKLYSTSLSQGFYAQTYADTTPTALAADSLYNEVNYNIFEHKSGIKGFYRGFNYRLHLRQRFLTYSNPMNNFSTSKNENFLGIWLNQYFKDSTKIYAELEYLVGKDYRFKFEYQGKWLSTGFTRTYSSPTLAQQFMYNNSYRWTKTGMNNVLSDVIYASASPRVGKFVFRPSVDITRLENYIYFDQKGLVTQTDAAIGIFRTGLGIDFRKGMFSAINQVYLTTTSGPDLVRIPKVFINSRLALDILYAKRLYITTGLELHYKSNYYANAYMPATQQFYLQDTQLINGYLQADAFADLRINRVRLFFKFSHVNSGILAPGYYAAPGFAGIGRTFAMGVDWPLFD